MDLLLNQIHGNTAGIDIGAQTHYVAVPPGHDPEGKDVRSLESFTAGLYALANWLKQCNTDKVAMESTGVYWILVDCRWLQQLHTFGLLQGAFRPDSQTCELRAYLRQRIMLVSYAAEHIQHMQNALEQMNIKLHQRYSRHHRYENHPRHYQQRTRSSKISRTEKSPL